MRVTIERTIWSKVQTQLSKDRNKELKDKMRFVQVTFSPSHDAILWDPPIETITVLKELLINEKGFMRKPESASYLLMTKVIERLEKLTKKDDAQPA